jgi:2-iminobutanoate/2-iminopropanoate deaminase
MQEALNTRFRDFNMQIIHGDGVPTSHLPFSPAVRVSNLIFVSGQASVDEKGTIVVDTFANEMRRSFENLRKILTAAGLSFSHVAQVRSYVGKPEYLAEYNQIYREFFSAPFPARTTIVNCLGEALKYEIDVIAVAPEGI